VRGTIAESAMSLLHPLNHHSVKESSVKHANVYHYDAISHFFHWSIVTLLVIQYFSGWVISPFGFNASPSLAMMWHATIGSLLFILLIASIVWSIFRPYLVKKPFPYTSHTSKVINVIIYALALALPVTGWLQASIQGWTIRFAGLIPLPSIMIQGLNSFALAQWHLIFSALLLLMIAVHIVHLLYSQWMNYLENNQHSIR
jgi:cytochrome b561